MKVARADVDASSPVGPWAVVMSSSTAGRTGCLRAVTLVLTTFFSHVLSCGVSYSLGVYYVTFLEIFDRSNGVTSWVGSLNTGMLCMAGPLSSVMIDRTGIRCTVMTGALLASAGLATSAFSSNIYQLFATLGVITGIGYGMVFTSSVVVIANSIPRHRSLAIGFSVSGIGVGHFLYPFLVTWFTGAYDWRGSLLITSGLTLNICLFGMLMDRASRSRDQARGRSAEGDVALVIRVSQCDADCSPPPRPKSRDVDVMTRSAQSLYLFVPSQMATHSKMVSRSSQDVNQVRYKGMRRSGPSELFCSMPHLGDPIGTVPEQNDLSPESKAISTSRDIRTANAASQWERPEPSRDCGAGRAASDRSCDCLAVPQLHACTLYSYWFLHCSTSFFFFSLSVIFTHVYAYARHTGLNERQAASVVSVNGAASIMGRILLGLLAQRRWISPMALCLACYVTAALACVMMTVWISLPGLVTCSAVFGFCWAAGGPVLLESIMDTVGFEQFNFAYGFVELSMALGTLLGAPAAGLIYDLTKMYTSSFYLGGATLLLSGLLMVPPMFIERASCLHLSK